MYYILNETDQIIAADENLLTLCNAQDVNELSSKVEIGDTSFTLNEADVTINTNGSEETYSVSKISLSSIHGNMTLVQIAEPVEVSKSDDIIMDDLLLDTEEEKSEPIDLNEEVSFDISTQEDESELFEIMDTVEEETISQPEEQIAEPDETFDLLSDPEEDHNLDTIVQEEDVSEIVVDVTQTSQIMGISDEDYKDFLSEYIDTALALEQDLQSDDTQTRNSAIMTLTDLSEIMHLPEISAIMENIHASTPEQQLGYIGSLYTTLSRLTTQSSAKDTEVMELFDTAETSGEISEPEVAAEPHPNSFGTIDLSEVKPKHFDFQLEEAANDLSLPVELIEEFVHDFIEQAHVETKNMLKAYEEGDLAKIQSIGHLLKGASSNLRINALSDTLYKIQFCENEIGLDDLIKDYWAHFLSFENQINVISN